MLGKRASSCAVSNFLVDVAATSNEGGFCIELEHAGKRARG